MIKVKTSILFLMFFFLATSLSFASSNDVATLEEVKGEVFVTRSGGKLEYRAKNGMYLYQGDSIRTDKNSSVKINFGDEDVTLLGENAKITLAQFSNEMEQMSKSDFTILAVSKGKKVAVKQESGKTWTKVKNLLDSGKRHKVETATAVMGVRGTLFLTEVAANGQVAVTVLDGQVGVNTDRSSSEENEQTINPGQRNSLVGTNFQTEPVNFQDLFNQIDLDLGRVMIEDTLAETEAAVQEAEKMLEAFLSNQEDEQLAIQSIQSISYAELLAAIVEKMVEGAKQSSINEIFLEPQFNGLNQIITRISESIQVLSQQANRIIEQLNLPESVRQVLAEQQKLMEEMVNENTYSVPTPTPSSDNDSDTEPTMPPSTGEEPPVANEQFAPWYTGDYIYMWDLGLDEVVQARETQEYKDLSGGVMVTIEHEDFIGESGYNFEYFTIRGSTKHQFYTMDQLLLRGDDPIFYKNNPIFYEEEYDEGKYILPLQPEQSNLNWFTVIFYDQNDRPLGYYQKEISSFYFYYPDKVGPAGDGYNIEDWDNNYHLTLYWTAPINKDHVTGYKINNDPIDAYCLSWGTCLYTISNITLEPGQSEIYRIAAVFDDGTSSEELEIVVPLDYPDCAECGFDGNKLENHIPNWIEDSNGGYSAITYHFTDPINFQIFYVTTSDSLIFDRIVFYSDDEEIAKINNFYDPEYPYYFLNLSNVTRIEGHFTNPILEQLADLFVAYGDAVEPFNILTVKDIQSNQVTIELNDKFFANLDGLDIYVNGIEYSYDNIGNFFIISDLEPNQTYVIYFDMQIMRYRYDDYYLVDRVYVTTSGG